LATAAVSARGSANRVKPVTLRRRRRLRRRRHWRPDISQTAHDRFIATAQRGAPQRDSKPSRQGRIEPMDASSRVHHRRTITPLEATVRDQFTIDRLVPAPDEIDASRHCASTPSGNVALGAERAGDPVRARTRSAAPARRTGNHQAAASSGRIGAAAVAQQTIAFSGFVWSDRLHAAIVSRGDWREPAQPLLDAPWSLAARAADPQQAGEQFFMRRRSILKLRARVGNGIELGARESRRQLMSVAG
jgi:hypothetical protein